MTAVWIALHNFRGEGSDILGIYANERSARAAASDTDLSEWSPLACEWYSVEEHQVQL